MQYKATLSGGEKSVQFYKRNESYWRSICWPQNKWLNE